MLVPRAALDLALPLVKTLPESADFSKTVQPYLPQLYDLPYKVFDSLNNWEVLQHVYLSTNPLMTALAFAIFLTPIVFVVAEINRNYSQVDRLWSLLPTIYNIHYAAWAHGNGLPTLRLDHIMAVSIIWSARLTFNYWRKGGYSVGSEDYRWNIVKDYVGPVGMFIFDITFIAFIQNILLFAITTPTYVLLLNSRITGNELSTYDTILGRTMLVLVVIEFFADQQQWNFHKAKAAYQKFAKVPTDYKLTREQLDRGFNTSGLWAWSRHPNFAAEQAVWMCLYQWGCLESQTYMNWTFAGAFSYLILFQGSTWLTELLSAGKYPEYKVYQQRVGKFLPSANTKSMEAPKTEKEKEKVESAKAGKGAKKL
ncbi:DUF1295-domain-containing protein [Dothidotthia symphoricarpi CBS 119687]|uniref:DUF1295-domain-containing protein n=1 Tax=Dothidotthia symphoricarpi CBS 119687 TaxID=1392245 RepID=A0A6A6A515_9PLEO|nr:DUF1295-domain-containing protein [Dothidotthia symphoricarpi CBS 119687]KAF2125691.1 DUF1295-domain-containing protein [Dothidotthia symphoricarpi CBS 119687]